VVHGQLDYRVDLSEGYQAFTAANGMGLDAKFLYFPDEGHWVLRPRNRRHLVGHSPRLAGGAPA